MIRRSTRHWRPSASKAMATGPEDRYPTPKALADDLDRWMADEPVTAWREPLARGRGDGRGRNRTAVTATAVALVAGIVALSAVLAVQTRANSVLTAKNAELDKANRLKDEANTELREANQRVSKANADLESGNKREKQRFDLAMEAISLFHGQVGGDLVLKADQFKPLRDKLLKGAADFYRKLEGLLKDQPDRASRSGMASAYRRLAILTAEIGDKSAAMESHRQSPAIWQKLADDNPAIPKFQRDLALLPEQYRLAARPGRKNRRRDQLLQAGRGDLAEARRGQLCNPRGQGFPGELPDQHGEPAPSVGKA